ncbi:MAG: hypothetical protein RMA76_43535 [Deltaproteobacteria bacterium]|jgi:tetratricopeptide (TPR) repeat protein
MKRLALLLWLPLLVGAAAEDDASPPPEEAPPEDTGPRRPAAPPEVFEDGLGDYYSDDFVGSAAKMYDYVSTNEPTVENYEWAEYFLGVSLENLGFKHAAAEYLFNVAKNRSRPEILPDALTHIEALLEDPHDERLLDDMLIVEGDFGYLPSYVSAFVFYHQGLADLRAGRLPWAERLFDEIGEDSRYYARALYALGVQRLTKNRLTDAVKYFRRALAHPAADRVLRNEARLALARVLYEKEAYKAALAMYEQVEVPELSIAEASLYLEKAWTSYWLRDYRQTMGILYALEAPSYRDYFAPEKYLLRALVYKDLCHYIPAKREIRRFRFRHAETLENIRERIDLREDDVLRTAALGRGQLGRIAAFRRMIADEADRIDTIGGTWVEVDLDDHLREIYALKAEQTDLKLDAALRRKTRDIAEELVEFEEQMYLLDYEVGLAIYRRLRKEDARRPTEEDDLTIPLAGNQAFYAFDEEFWNDELPDYDFFVENRCFDERGGEL